MVQTSTTAVTAGVLALALTAADRSEARGRVAEDVAATAAREQVLHPTPYTLNPMPYIYTINSNSKPLKPLCPFP